ncbi:transcriptional initiation protein Tat, partial [Myxococcus xanthus]|nr:transcriptional initiation protein Tat [Myxococcus xanthus]
GGRFRMGRFLRVRDVGSNPLGGWTGPGTPLRGAVAHNKLLVSIARAFGVNVNTFGNPDYTGELPGLT